MSVIQGGTGFPLLADEVIQYLSTGKSTGIHVADEDLPLMMKSLFQEVKHTSKTSVITIKISYACRSEQPQLMLKFLPCSVMSNPCIKLHYWRLDTGKP